MPGLKAEAGEEDEVAHGSQAPLVGDDGGDLVLGVHGLGRVHPGGLGRWPGRWRSG